MNCKSRWCRDHSFPTLNSGFTQTFNTEFQSRHPMEESTHLPLFQCLHLQHDKSHISPSRSKIDGRGQLRCGIQLYAMTEGSWNFHAGRRSWLRSVCVHDPSNAPIILPICLKGSWEKSGDNYFSCSGGETGRFLSTLKCWRILCQHTKVAK